MTPSRPLSAWLVPLLLTSVAGGQGHVLVPQSGGNTKFKPHGDPHNVLLVIMDDVGTDMLGCYGEGGDLPPTPTLDSLAAEGVLFRDAWAAPICSPTRALIQTGLHGYKNHIGALALDGIPGAFLPLELTILPEVLEGSEMTCAFFGKWHLGTQAGAGFFLAPNLAGYEHYEGALIGLNGNYNVFLEVENGNLSIVQNYSATEKVDDFLEWQSEVPEPWFGTLSFELAHAPFHAPPAHLHSIDVSGGDDRSYYKAMVQALDTELARVLLELGKKLERTTIIVIGDNGTPQDVTAPPFAPSHAKGTLYEGGVRVPLIVSGRAVKKSGESRALVHALDIFATVAEIAGVDAADAVAESGVGMDSLSLAPYLEDPDAPSERVFNLAEFFCPAGVGHGRVITLPPDHCQELLGYQGPGSVDLGVCGGILSSPNHGDVAVSGAPAGAQGTVYFWQQDDPTPVMAFGGTLVGDPENPWMEIEVTMDASGEFVQADFVDTTFVPGAPICGGLPAPGIERALMQAVIDAGDGTSLITNAVRLEYVPANIKTIRDRTHKLVRYMNLSNLPLGATLDEFFQLEDGLGRDVDFFETNNLLDSPLSPQNQAALDTLTGALNLKFGVLPATGPGRSSIHSVGTPGNRQP